MNNPNTDFPSIGCVIMASGISKRFGSNKLMADLCGKPLISYILDVTEGIPFAKRLVMTRSADVARLCHERGIPVLLHEYENRNEAIRLALGQFSSLSLDGCMFCLADQPLLKSESLSALMNAFKENPSFIHRLCFEENTGNPMLFPKQYFSELSNLPQKKGGGFLAKKYPEQVRLTPVQDKYELFDLDTREDLQTILQIILSRKKNI